MIITESDYKRFAIYRLWRRRDNVTDLVYVGALPVSQLLTLQDAREFSNYGDYIKPHDATQIEIISISDTPDAARTAADEHGKQSNAVLNVLGKRAPATTGKRKRPIICINSGQEYASAAEACEKLGISPSSLSQHLRGKRNYGMVAGRVFKYVETENEQ